eukprot:7058106-Pyramimonas_sp.AAC.1
MQWIQQSNQSFCHSMVWPARFRVYSSGGSDAAKPDDVPERKGVMAPLVNFYYHNKNRLLLYVPLRHGRLFVIRIARVCTRTQNTRDEVNPVK